MTRLIFFLFCISTVIACNTLHTMTRSIHESPREKYVASLTKNNLLSSSMAKAWLDAGDMSKNDSIIIALPFRETGFFAASEPQAKFYRIDVKQGQVLTLTSLVKTKYNAKLFIDLFSRQSGEWKLLTFSDSLSLAYEIKESATCLVRLQPELLSNMYYSITLSVTPVLLNPVKGASNKSIGSFYGDPRDGGKRRHEGIDIFAPKGTPVVAPTDGVVSRVAWSSLGGKTVWMNDLKRRHSYYFAHLDSQIAKAGMKVRQGDVLGTVGNTGNAIHTPSHLHFGVFQNTSKDPVAYIRTMEKLVNELTPDTLFQSIAFKVVFKTVAIYAGPSKKQIVRTTLTRDTYLKVIAQSEQWYRVTTAGNLEGFVEKKQIAPAEKGNKLVLKKETLLLSEASSDAVPVATLKGDVTNLAVYNQYRFVRTASGVTGWVELSPL